MQQTLNGETTPQEAGFIYPTSVGLFVNDEIAREKGPQFETSHFADLKHVKGGK